MVPINYWAVVVAAVAQMIIGGLWYGPLFGKQWAMLSGMTGEKMEAAKKKGMAMSYALMFVGSLVMAYVLSHAPTFGMAYLGSYGVSGGMSGAFWYWLGFIAPVSLGVVLWEMKSWKLWFLNVGYYLISLLVMGAIIGGWQ